jgi:hypothetical protein
MSAPRSGPAVIHLRGGREYVANHAELDRGIISFTGRLRVRGLAGERVYERVTRSHRLASSEWVEWECEDA